MMQGEREGQKLRYKLPVYGYDKSEVMRKWLQQKLAML